MSLRLRLGVLIATALLATLVVGSGLIYLHAVAKVETEMRAAIAVGTRIARNAVDDAEEVGDPRRRLELLVADFDGDRHLRASLIDANKMVSRVSTLAPPEDGIPEPLLRLLERKPDRVQVQLPAAFTSHGSIVLENDAVNEIGEVWRDALLYLGILAGFSLAVLAVTVATVGRVLAPIERLHGAFGRIGGGDYRARVAIDGPPELSRLCHGFNEMGERLQDMDEKTRRLHRQLDAVQEEERADLARNLHDDFSPMLFSVDVDATLIRRFLDEGDKDHALERADAVRQTVSQMKRQVKSLLGRLRPAILVDLGLATAIDHLAQQWRLRHPGVEFRIAISRSSFGPKLDAALFHIIRESVSNALRHGKPRLVDITLHQRVASAVFLEVVDDGGGLDMPRHTEGFGIRGMHERAVIEGGTLSVQNRHDAPGVIVLARFPYANSLDGPVPATEGTEARAA